MDTDIRAVFAKHHLRVTNARLAVFQTLKHATKPLSHSEIAQLTPSIDRVSVYRTIDIFIKLNIVTGVAYGWKQRYELAAPFRPHHHHLLCTHCHHIEEIQSHKLEKVVDILASRQGFKPTGHTFEITGLCEECQGL